MADEVCNRGALKTLESHVDANVQRRMRVDLMEDFGNNIRQRCCANSARSTLSVATIAAFRARWEGTQLLCATT